MRLLIATDAWHPQVNGVVRSLHETATALAACGVDVEFITPSEFPGLPLPSYPEIKIAIARASRVEEKLARFDALHIATEGPVGLAARRACMARNVRFTTSYHTRFPEYLRARAPVPERWTYKWLRRFHNAGSAVMASTRTLQRELAGRGFERVVIWSRGVDTNLFCPREARGLDLPRPILLYVGRIAVEKNLEAFLTLQLPGTKVVVGDGPQRDSLERQYRDAAFLGVKMGKELAAIYASADVFVFPSRTDTYGMVILEALASGLPVAAFPVPGPADIIADQPVGALNEDLRVAVLDALRIPRPNCRQLALRHSWQASTREFLSHIVPLKA
jgi:glycosyltransferase involved in cell wall biosynthesis